ncbi:MmcQ/YjbR family DNA-binding protein [Solirubrobacter sp. CPCC 204708]|uniref:MmcQ/YjbR family DNA-binding protein n=1 Tax=Solirubrobacter deserti TaxID=2282478 RepID=A0ABT4RRQ2_9ACTN|nr:MmcQ/YjbR family DNA-binding protein [Solirubrobacter deserti]MBE2317569.1 MmcQ/YjbR family DNA-binding protein [Solirubrobacter deserti]MDA0141263.1 MmcQ/YjbR family DNA-binding protein [Solirubrobacter deserti]
MSSELDRVREICLALPEVTERLSHGHPTWFVRDKKTFVSFHDNHHHDGRLALWCAAPEGMQETLVAGEPRHYFRPPYVGHRGWIGVNLDSGLDWNEIAGAIEDAYAEIAPKSLVERAARRSQ